jgi:hypothetical protein
VVIEDYATAMFSTARNHDDSQITQPGAYVTNDTIFSSSEAMTESIGTGISYQTRLVPPPGPPADSDGDFIPMAQWDLDRWPSHIHIAKGSDEREP